MRTVNTIVACSSNRVIGVNGRLPWSIPEDWNYFLDQTKGGILIMGRVAYEEMVALDEIKSDRLFIIVTKNNSLASKGVLVSNSVKSAINLATSHQGQIWICGGQRIYEESLPESNLLYLTAIKADIIGDTFFPSWKSEFKTVISKRMSNDKNYSYTFFVLSRN